MYSAVGVNKRSLTVPKVLKVKFEVSNDQIAIIKLVHDKLSKSYEPDLLSLSLKLAGVVKPEVRVKDLTEQQVGLINTLLTKEYRVEGELRRETSAHMQRLTEIGCYRGHRHRRSLPARGQRTKTNARTRKGPRKTVGVVRQKAERAVTKDSGTAKK